MTRCPLCGGEKAPGRTIYSVDLGTGVVVVRNVPAEICKQCGEEWIGAETARRLEAIVEKARQERPDVEIVTLG
ncbi:MAG: type II toxin-antitoxin system MqsA family antitoxin [Deltaproteobacteria bacterium]|nr:type II toxin-antitoxin system MqsA family antitoxin [Deltaproteobacteria bacterium]